MSKLRVFFVISLVIFGVLLVRVFFWPMVSGKKYSGVSRESIIQSEDAWRSDQAYSGCGHKPSPPLKTPYSANNIELSSLQLLLDEY